MAKNTRGDRDGWPVRISSMYVCWGRAWRTSYVVVVSYTKGRPL